MTRLAFLAGVAALLAGCHTVPTVDTVRTVAYAAGAGTALVMNETKLDCDKRAVVRDIVKEVRECVPEVGQPLETAWTPIAQRHVDLLVEEGRIDAAAGTLVMAGFKTVMVGVNLIEQRYPSIRSSRDYADSAIEGFTTGFLEKFDVGCSDCTLKATAIGIDLDVATEVRRAAIRGDLK